MDLLADLNEPQRKAVCLVDGPLLVLAGAGSGKTRVIARRVAHLIAQGIRPRHILAITFTNKAAGEMARRVAQLRTPSGATICTFHSLCARLLREFADQAGVSRNFSIYDRADQLRLVKEVMTRANLRTGSLSPGRLHAAISKAKNALQGPGALAAEGKDPYWATVAKIHREYDKALTANNALDFDDLLLRVASMMRDRPELREFLGQRYRYVLIDEYQDTNRAQYVIAHGIVLDHENICVTGDPDQSIYAWRGADISNILEFESDYPAATVIRLEENYRSTEPILNAASRLIGHNTLRKDKALWTRREGGADVAILFCDDHQAEASLVAQRIAGLRAEGIAYDDVAIFYRLNSLSRVMEQTLLNSGIPYRIARGVEFYNRKEVKDVLAYLRVMVNPSDDLSCTRIVNVPTRGIGRTTVARLAALAEDKSIGFLDACDRAEAAGFPKAAEKKVKAFAELIAELRGEMDKPVREIMEAVVSRSGLEASLSGDQESREAYANIEELISTAEEFDNTALENARSLFDYLNQVSLVSDVDHVEGGGGAVSLMTLHAAKGLEFPSAFIIGCEDGLLPFSRGDGEGNGWSSESLAQMEEERRLAFVGMTRAKDRLTLTCARQRMVRGRTKPQAASPFLSEIGTGDVNVEDLTTPAHKPRPGRRRKPRGGFYADVAERNAIEAACHEAQDFPPEYEYLKPGCRVHHPMFGLGEVVTISSHPWPDTRATIQFDRLGRKKIVLNKAHLELLSED